MSKTITLTDEQYELLKELQGELETQDNRHTTNPVYGVMAKRRFYGMDSSCADDYEWYNDTETYDEEEVFDYLLDSYVEELNEVKEFEELNSIEEVIEKYSDDLEGLISLCNLDDDWYKVYYITEDVITSSSFSLFEKDSFDHVKTNGHNLGDCRSYAFSNQRTPRMEKLRKLLIEVSL